MTPRMYSNKIKIITLLERHHGSRSNETIFFWIRNILSTIIVRSIGYVFSKLDSFCKVSTLSTNILSFGFLLNIICEIGFRGFHELHLVVLHTKIALSLNKISKISHGVCFAILMHCASAVSDM